VVIVTDSRCLHPIPLEGQRARSGRSSARAKELFVTNPHRRADSAPVRERALHLRSPPAAYGLRDRAAKGPERGPNPTRNAYGLKGVHWRRSPRCGCPLWSSRDRLHPLQVASFRCGVAARAGVCPTRTRGTSRRPHSRDVAGSERLQLERVLTQRSNIPGTLSCRVDLAKSPSSVI